MWWVSSSISQCYVRVWCDPTVASSILPCSPSSVLSPDSAPLSEIKRPVSALSPWACVGRPALTPNVTRLSSSTCHCLEWPAAHANMLTRWPLCDMFTCCCLGSLSGHRTRSHATLPFGPQPVYSTLILLQDSMRFKGATYAITTNLKLCFSFTLTFY